MPERLPVLDLIGREVRSERTALTVHANALDTKSSVVLGFAGALTTLSAAQEGVLTGAATVVSGLAALIALWAFQPRAYPVVEVGALRDKYATSDSRFAEHKLLDTYIQMCDALAGQRSDQGAAALVGDQVGGGSGRPARSCAYHRLRCFESRVEVASRESNS